MCALICSVNEEYSCAWEPLALSIFEKSSNWKVNAEGHFESIDNDRQASLFNVRPRLVRLFELIKVPPIAEGNF